MPFLKRNPPPAPVAEPIRLYPDAPAQQHAVKIHLMARSSDAVRMPGDSVASVSEIVDRIASQRIEIVEPLPLEWANAAPTIERLEDLELWIRARGDCAPVTRHALYVLESVDALDMTVDTFVCGLLSGATDTHGYPDYQAIVGGVATRWDEATGDLLARAVVAWGGRGVRGDTDRRAQALVDRLHGELTEAGATAPDTLETVDSAGDGRSELICAHCGFETASARAFFCTRCGLRMSRGA